MYLTYLKIPASTHSEAYPFNIPIINKGIELDIEKPVTFIVGENGSGKSTLLETIAFLCGFSVKGGSKSHQLIEQDAESNLYRSMKLGWLSKPYDGFFLRAESFYDFANYLDSLGSPSGAYGDKSLNEQSHGESFLSLFANKFDRGLFILDEPEAALSPMRQLSLLTIIKELELNGKAQFIISTHSPILITYPGADIFNIQGDSIVKVGYEETEHYQTYKNFLNDPERYHRYLFPQHKKGAE